MQDMNKCNIENSCRNHTLIVSILEHRVTRSQKPYLSPLEHNLRIPAVLAKDDVYCIVFYVQRNMGKKETPLLFSYILKKQFT